MSRESRALTSQDEPQIKPQPRPGAYLCESTATHAGYWLKNGRELPDRDEAVLAVEQAINSWKNLAYGLAEKLHFSGYDPTTGQCERSERQGHRALWLRADGGERGIQHAVLLIEKDGKWIELIRETQGGPFSHIIEPLGIAKRIGERDGGKA